MSGAYLGHGVGLRVPHYGRALQGGLDVDWVEVITENFFGGGGRPWAVLEALRRELPVVFHGVSLGIGSLDGRHEAYLERVKPLAAAFEPAWLSDHLCWSSFGGHFSHDLLPLPYTEEALRRVVENVGRVQEVLGREILLENVSSYVGYNASQMPEWQFLSEVALRSGCFILLDLNNIIVSAHNHGFSPRDYLQGVPAHKVRQYHLANHTDLGTHKLDDHRGAVPGAVWELFEAAVQRFGPVSSLIEWDEDVPSWDRLRAEQREAGRRAFEVLQHACPELGLAQGAMGAQPSKTVPGRVPELQSRTVTADAPTLEQAQRLFFRAITWPEGSRDFLARADAGTQRELEHVFASSEAFDRVERLDVYADAYFYRLLSALAEVFPRLAYLAGSVQFHNLITDYVLDYPSIAPDLRRLGDRLPEFVRGHERCANAALLADLASLERALGWSLDCPEGGRVSRAELEAVPIESWPGLCLVLAQPSRRIETEWDLVAIAGLCDRAERDAALALAPEARPCSVLVGRTGLRGYLRRLGAGEARALAGFHAGSCLEAVCADLALHDPSFQPSDMVGNLQRWLDAGVIGSLSLQPASVASAG